jgi:poly-gamma-glutamate capsule biosynthesis protein CapA/YwtB (metallophosphatase superfamily)
MMFMRLFAFQFQSLILIVLGCAPDAPQPTIEGRRETSNTVRIVFVGDILLDEGAAWTMARSDDPFKNVSAILKDADLAVGNLESPIANNGRAIEKPFTFRAHPSAAGLIADYFGAVSLANNHSGDFGPFALQETMKNLRAAKVPFFGAGHNLSEAHEPFILTRRGVRIGLLGYNEFLPRAFEATADRPGVAWSEDEQVIRDIKRTRALGADIVIPFLHWGWENEDKPCARQVELARKMIDAGADAVVGTHPHVTQTFDTYKGKPVVYSLGNFVFSLIDYEANSKGWMLRLDINAEGIVKWDIITVKIDDSGTPQIVKPIETPSKNTVCSSGKNSYDNSACK